MPAFQFTISAVFDLCGYRTRQINLTPALGLALIAVVVYLVGATTMR